MPEFANEAEYDHYANQQASRHRAPRFEICAYNVTGHEVAVMMNPAFARMLSRVLLESEIDEEEKAIVAFAKQLRDARTPENHNRRHHD